MDTTLRKALLYTITGIVSEKQRCPRGSGKAKDPRAGNNNHTRVLGKMGNTHIHRHTQTHADMCRRTQTRTGMLASAQELSGQTCTAL